jgi:hypothetical protein
MISHRDVSIQREHLDCWVLYMVLFINIDIYSSLLSISKINYYQKQKIEFNEKKLGIDFMHSYREL